MHPPETRRRALALIRAGHNDCEVSRRTGVPRTTVRDWRRPRYVPRTIGARRGGWRGCETCPRCGRASRQMRFSDEDYTHLLGLYLGDGHIVRLARTFKFRLFLDSRYGQIVSESRDLLQRCFPNNDIGSTTAHAGRMTILSAHSLHLPCVFPQHGAGAKHDRPIELEPWQQRLVEAAPWAFLKGLIRSDGCSFINRTGPYEYLSYHFANHSQDILDLFCSTCDATGVQYRRYARAVRINRRASVTRLEAEIGVKR